MCDDRTAEFFALANSLPADRSSFRDKPKPAPQQQPAYQQLREFHTNAASISRDIASTSALLSELSQRVQNPRESDDINPLVVRIKGAIENLNRRLDQAGWQLQQQKRSSLKDKSQAGLEATNRVDGLKEEFAIAASGFKKTLQQRTDNLTARQDWAKEMYGEERPSVANAMPHVYGSAESDFPTLDLTSSMATGQPTGSLPRPHGIAGGPGAMPTYSGSYSTMMTPFDIQQQDDAQQLTTELIPVEHDYLNQRADAMEQVESNLVELGAVFNKLAVMVSEHREMVQRVEDNVEDANANVNLSMQVLTDTLTNLRTNRGLALRVFSILVLFIFAFIIFFA